MQEINEGFKKVIESKFPNVRAVGNSLKFNVKQLDSKDVVWLHYLNADKNKVTIKRSGTGLVVIIE